MKLKLLSFLLTLLPFLKAMSQFTIQLKIDTSYCCTHSPIEGKLGFYGTTRYGQQIDTLIKPLRIIENQEIIVPSDSLMNFRLVFTPSDTSNAEIIAPLYYFSSLDNTVQLDSYFFRKPIQLLDHLENKDTLFITKEYRGISHAGMTFPRSTFRIVKKDNKFYYSRNDLPTHGDLVITIFPGGKYENGFSEEKLLTKEQLHSVRLFETDIVRSISYMFNSGMSEIRIGFKGKTYRFTSNMNIPNANANLIWEKLD